MTRYLLIGTCAAILGGGGVALAQMPPGPEGQGGPMGPERMMMMRHMHHGWSGGGTRFHFRKGDAEVDVRCSSQEPLQSCVTGATTLLDKLNAAGAAKPAQ